MKSVFIHSKWAFSLGLLCVWVCIRCTGCLQAERTNPIDGDLSSLITTRLKVLRPNGAEYWYAGTEHQIVWTPGELDTDLTVRLRLSSDDGKTYPHVIATDIPNTGVFAWHIPDLPSKQSRIQIISSDSLDVSDAAFSILRKPVPRQVTFQGGEWPSWRLERLAFMSNRTGNYDIWVIDSQLLIQVTTDTADDKYPAFDKKASHLAFTSERSGSEQIWATARFLSGGDPTPIQLTTIGGRKPGWQPFPKAQRLVFVSLFRGNTNLATLDFSKPLTPSSLISEPRFRMEKGRKERPTWFIDQYNDQYIYYQDSEMNQFNFHRILIEDGFVDYPPETIRLPLTSLIQLHNPALSAGGGKLAFSMSGDIWVVSMRNGRTVGKPLQITFDPGEDDVPDWRSDTELAFQSNRTGQWEIWTVELP